MTQQTNSSSSSSGFGEGPIRVGGSSFSRPAALIGGAVALVALTAIATTLVVRPGNGAAHGGDAMVAAAQLPSDGSKTRASGQVADDEVAPTARPEPKAQPKPAPSASTERKPAVTAAKAPAAQKTAAACATCGTVEAVTPVTKKGDASGLGAVGGAVIGGVIGNQMGSGRGNDAMTAIGVVGGGIAGHEIEKRHKATTVYQVKVRMDDGSTRTVTQSNAPAVGAKVTLEGSQLKPRAS